MIGWVAVRALLLSLIILPAGSAGREVTVIAGATVIDCAGGAPIPDAVVVIEDGKIKAVGRKGEVRTPRGARIIDASGKYLLPGLIDMHVHYREWQGELFLAHGVTTVKDLGNPVEWIAELSRMQVEGRLRGPKIFYVGNNLDAPPPEGDHHVAVGGGTAEKAVRLLRGSGVAAIKVRHKVTPELLGEITGAARRAGLPVTGHLGATDAMEAARRGIDGLEHASGVARAATRATDQIKTDAKGVRAFFEDMRGFALMDKDREAALVSLLVEKKVTLIPTLSVRRRAILEDYAGLAREDDRLARDPALAYVPERVRRDWSEAMLDRSIRGAFDRKEMQLMREGYRRLELFVLAFRRKGGTVLAGSDNLGGVAGLTLHRELEGLVAAGLTPMEALIAATKDAALFLRRSDLGTVRPGRTADLLIVGANPLDDIKNLGRIEKVFQNGREQGTGFHRDYAMPPARPELARPLLLERRLTSEK